MIQEALLTRGREGANYGRIIVDEETAQVVSAEIISLSSLEVLSFVNKRWNHQLGKKHQPYKGQARKPPMTSVNA